MEVKFYQLKTGFARRNNLLIYFVAKTLAETDKAYYLYGHGTTASARTGVCCRCGRTLTHPVSVELGIGPECGGHYHNWDLIGGYTKENLERLKGALIDVKIDSWIPKSQIVCVIDSQESVDVPNDHKMLQRKQDTSSKKRTATMAVDEHGERVIKISFPYGLEDIERVRKLPNRRYYKEDRCWSTPPDIKVIEYLKEWGFDIDPSVTSFMKSLIVKDIPGLKGELFPFQKDGVAFIESHGGRALIADEMGLGKTIQALAWLQLHPEKRPAVVVVPASLKLNWLREIHKWMSTGAKTIILSGTTPSIIPKDFDIIIINYDILPNEYETNTAEGGRAKKKDIPRTGWVDYILELNPKVLITDECHYYKSNKANRTLGVRKLGKDIPHILALSGTPIVNRPIEAFNAIRLINPFLFKDQWYFAKHYCNARYNGFGWDLNGASNTSELHKILTDNIMIRRRKEDVLKELPNKIYSFVPIELDNKQEYQEAKQHLINFIRKTKGDDAAHRATMAEQLAEIEILKQVAIKGKMSQAISWISDFLEVDGKLVVFATHRTVIDTLIETFGSIAVKIDGDVSQINRQKAVDDFQNNPDIRLFVGNIKAAGVGITLTASSNVAFLELPWTPGELSQAEDRCHRIGQKNSVNIHYLLAEGTIDEQIAHLLDRKRTVVNAVMDGILTEDWSALTELIKEYGEDVVRQDYNGMDGMERYENKQI